LNKTDLVNEKEKAEIREEVLKINAGVEIIET